MSDISFRKILGLNQQTYQRLKLALSLNLRRQIFIAVCDDLPLRDRLAEQLQADLANPSPIQVDRLRAEVGARGYPRMVTMQLNPTEPNPIVQIAQWLAQSPPPRSGKRRLPIPAFQFLGIEQLTRQPATVQRLFLTHLQGIERSLPVLDSTLLFWVPQPWFRVLPQSALEFWRCRTAVFEFVGDPTPLPPRPITQIEVVPHPPQSAICEAATEAKTEVATEAKTSSTPAKTVQVASFSLQSPPAQSLPLSVSVDSTVSAVVFDLAPRQATAIASPSPATSSSPAAPAEPTAPDPQARLVTMEAIAAHLPHRTSTLLPEDVQVAQLLDQIAALHQQQVTPAVLAEAYRILADVYRNRIEQGDTALSTLTAALQAYEQVLIRLPNGSPQWSDLLNDVGNLCWLLSRHVPTAEHAVPYLQQGIQTYHLALTKLNVDTQSENYPMIQNNLAAAYADLARYENPAEHLQQSAHAYAEALRYRDPQQEPLRYASTQNNLGTTYWNLAQYAQPQQHLKQAIAAYSEALHYYNPDQSNPDQDPLNYAMIQNNLGTASWNLSQFEQSEENLQAAIAAYQIALRYRTPDTAAPAFAATQNNLGTAYWHLAICLKDQLQDQAEHLQNAVHAYEAALLIATQLIQQEQAMLLSFDPYTTHNNLGLAYHQLALWQAKLSHAPAQTTSLETSLHHHLQAMQGWQQQSDLRQVAFKGVLQSLRTLYLEFGMAGQNLALSTIPAHLLPEIMAQL